MSMTKEEVYDVFRFYASKEFEDIPKHDSEIDYEFSDEFNKKMDKLLKRVRYDSTHAISWVAKKVLITATTIAIILTGLMSVSAIREPVVKFIYEIYEEFMEVFFEGDTTDIITYRYSFSEIPEGFVETNRISNDHLNIVQYENKTTECIIELSQSITKDISFFLDSENGHIANYYIDDIEINIFIGDYGNYYLAYWIKDSYSIKLTFSGQTTIEYLLKIIESIK